MSGAPSLDDELPSIGRASDGPIAGNGAADPFKQASNGHATPIELTVLTKTGGPLTKRLALAADGSLVRDGSACVMFRGNAVRAKVDGVTGLSALIETLTPSQAIALGGLRAELQDTVMVLTKRQLNGVTRPDIIARISGNIVYHGPAFVLLDYDTKGMPANVTAELKRYGGFWAALLTVLPSFGGVARVTRSSTSAGLSRADTGAAIPGSDGVHVFVTIKDGSDAERFLRTLHESCWLAGLGWLMVGAAGQLLDRSIIDRMVGGPERLVFEGGPVLAPPLVQDKESRRPITVEGATLDTLAMCPPLTLVERAQLNELKARERARLAPETAKARDNFVAVEANKLVARTGMPVRTAIALVTRWCEGVLRPDVELPFDDEALAGCTVGDVLANPERFEGETLADPLEGASYGRCCAKVMRRADGVPWIHSFAHGRTTYKLQHDVVSVRKAMEAAETIEVAACFATLAASADLDAVELEELRQLAKTLSGTGLRAINAMLKSAQQQQGISNAKAARDFRTLRRDDPRLRIGVPAPDEPWLPQIEVLNEVISAVVAITPPSRDIDDDMMWVRQLSVPGTHAFTDANPLDADDDTDDTEDDEGED